MRQTSRPTPMPTTVCSGYPSCIVPSTAMGSFTSLITLSNRRNRATSPLMIRPAQIIVIPLVERAGAGSTPVLVGIPLSRRILLYLAGVAAWTRGHLRPGRVLRYGPVDPSPINKEHPVATAERTDRIKGVLSPVVTPFKADLSPDPERFVRQCRWLLSQDVGLAVFGTNSEANSLWSEEKIELLDRLVAGGIDAARLMPGTGRCPGAGLEGGTPARLKAGGGG